MPPLPIVPDLEELEQISPRLLVRLPVRPLDEFLLQRGYSSCLEGMPSGRAVDRTLRVQKRGSYQVTRAPPGGAEISKPDRQVNAKAPGPNPSTGQIELRIS